MSTTTRIEIPATTTPADLPAGWSYGAHTSGAGWSGYHLIHESGVSVVAVERPDLDADDVDLAEVLGEAISD